MPDIEPAPSGRVNAMVVGVVVVEVWTHERCAAVRVFDDERQAHAEAVLDADELDTLIGWLVAARAGLAERTNA